MTDTTDPPETAASNWRHWTAPVLGALVVHAALLLLALPSPEPPGPGRPLTFRLVDPPPPAPREDDRDTATTPDVKPAPDPAPETEDAGVAVEPASRPEAAAPDPRPEPEPETRVTGATLRGRVLHAIRQTPHESSVAIGESEGDRRTALAGAPVPALPSRRGLFHPFVGRVEPRQHGGRIGPGLHQSVTVLADGTRLCTTTEIPGMFELAPAIPTITLCGRVQAEPPDPADPWLRTRLPDDTR